MTAQINKIYARCDSQNRVIKIFSEYFEQPLATDTVIDSTNTLIHGANKYQVTDDNGYYNYSISNGVLQLRDKTADTLSTQLNTLRQRRINECFDIVNRGQVWYDTLTTEQKTELNNWYKQWLDVTKTLSVPQTPDFIK